MIIPTEMGKSGIRDYGEKAVNNSGEPELFTSRGCHRYEAQGVKL